MNPIFVALGAYWKEITTVVIAIGIFYSGYHLRDIQEVSKIKDQLELQLSDTNNKILDNSKIDFSYNKIINDINDISETYRIEKSNEKNSACTIPVEWVHKLNSVSR